MAKIAVLPPLNPPSSSVFQSPAIGYIMQVQAHACVPLVGLWARKESEICQSFLEGYSA